MGTITFDTQDIDFIEGTNNSLHIFGSDDCVDYYLECNVDDDGITIDSGHSIGEDSVIFNDLNFDLLKKELNSQIAINKYSND